MRFVPLFLAGCAGAPQLAVTVDGAPLDGAIVFADARAHHEPTPVELVVTLEGGSRTPVVLRVGDDVEVLGDNDVSLSPGESATFLLQPRVDTDRDFDTPLTVRAGEAAVVADVSGTVLPWVQVALEDRPDVTAAMETQMEAADLVGLVVGVARGDTIVFLEGYGDADRENAVPVDPNVTLFRWASVSKGLTGIVALQAELDGLWSLDDPVSDWVEGYEVPELYLPNNCNTWQCAAPIPEAQRHVSVRDLLRHVGGAQHYTNGVGLPVPPPVLTDNPETNTGVAWALDYWVDKPLVAIPGTRYEYSTFGFNLAGAAVEGVRERPFDEIVLDAVARPLSMHTLAADRHWEALPNRAVGYVMGTTGIRTDVDHDVSWKAPGGGFLSTGADFTRYCAGLGGDVLMSEEERDGILWATAPPASGYGLGFFVQGPLVSHTGAQEKTRTAVAWVPEQDLCFTVMTNSTWANPNAILVTLMTAWAG